MKFKKHFSTIRSKILLGAITTVVLISSLIIIFSYFLVSTFLQTSMIQTSETKLSFLCSSIDSNVATATNFLRSCQVSQELRDFAMKSDGSDSKQKLDAHSFITEVLGYNNALSSLFVRMVVIGNNREDMIQFVESTYSTSKVTPATIRSLEYFDSSHWNSSDFSTKIELDPFLNRDIQMIPLVHPISHPYKAEYVGYIFSEMSASVITDPIKNYLSDNDSHILLRMDSNVYEYTNNSLQEYHQDYSITKYLSNHAVNPDTLVREIVMDNSEEAILVSRPLNTEGWYITEYLDKEKLSQRVFQYFLFIVLVIASFSIIICKMLFSFLSKTVNEPVKKLQERMNRISGGDFSRDPSVEWDHELGEIGRNINDLSENVASLIAQKLDDERQKKDYEYKMLQSQVNPHFLYNTLNSIKWMATIQNAPGIAEMTTALSRLLKDISKGRSTVVPISQEISLLNDYFTIQSYRYGGTITLSYEIEDEKLTTCKIPKFTLQPIVENAIFHGIEPKGNAGTILIRIFEDEKNDVHIDITDDGIGIEPDAIERLFSDDSASGDSFFREVGVRNVHKRLQYEFPGDYGLKIESQPGLYTTVTILIPKTGSETGLDERDV